MLQELLGPPEDARGFLHRTRRSAEQMRIRQQEQHSFLEQYRPIRVAVENFLSRGTMHPVSRVQEVEAMVVDYLTGDFGPSVLIPQLRPYWKNETIVAASDGYPALVIRAETDRNLYQDYFPFSGTIGQSMIRLLVASPDLPDRPAKLAFLPPVSAFTSERLNFRDRSWLAIPSRVGEIIPYLTQQPRQ